MANGIMCNPHKCKAKSTRRIAKRRNLPANILNFELNNFNICSKFTHEFVGILHARETTHTNFVSFGTA